MSLPELVIDLFGYAVSSKSRTVVFVPTSHPDKEKRVLKRASELHDMDPDANDIFSDDKWQRYLDRPEGAEFDDMTMVEFYRNYRQVFGGHRAVDDQGAEGIEPADGGGGDEGEQVERNQVQVFVDKSIKQRKYVKCTDQSVRVVRTKSVPLTDVEDAAVHLIKLHCPTRLDCEDWLRVLGFESYFEVARRYLSEEILESVVPFMANHRQDKLQLTQDRTCFSMLNNEQFDVLTMIIRDPWRHLVVGSAGTGKSTLLRALVHRLVTWTEFEPIILAPSGIAAVNVGGMTLHRFFGIVSTSPAVGDRGAVANPFMVDWQIHCIRAKKKRPFFILDEVSMVSKSLFEIMSGTLQQLTGQDGVMFGGVPIVCFGDFGQLGPIVKRTGSETGDGDWTEWLWTSDEFKEFLIYRLQVACRQGHGQDRFFQFLEIVRRGKPNKDEECLVRTVIRERMEAAQSLSEEDLPNLTILSSVVVKVQDANNEIMERMSSAEERVEFECIDSMAVNLGGEGWRRGMERETGLLTRLILWIGAKVIITSNIDVDNGIANGAMGVVEGFEDDGICVRAFGGRLVKIVRETRELSKGGASRSQFPLLLAYSMTIHRAQGMTLDKVLVDLEDVFCFGQGYVALSRVRRMTDLYIAGAPDQLCKLLPQDDMHELLRRI